MKLKHKENDYTRNGICQDTIFVNVAAKKICTYYTLKSSISSSSNICVNQVSLEISLSHPLSGIFII